MKFYNGIVSQIKTVQMKMKMKMQTIQIEKIEKKIEKNERV